MLDLWREFGFMYVTLFLLLDFSNNLSDTVIYTTVYPENAIYVKKLTINVQHLIISRLHS